jgi:hypothetical protein
VALVVVGSATGLQRLVTRSVATLGEDLRSRAMLAAQVLLADTPRAASSPASSRGPHRTAWLSARPECHILRCAHPRVWPDAGAAPCELWEVIRVLPA